MNFFFEEQYQYVVYQPTSYISSQLKAIIKTPWYEIAPNLTGVVSDDGTIKLHPKLSFPTISVFNIPQHITVLKGRLKQESDRSRIYVTVRPSYPILFSFYTLIIILLFETVRYDRNWILIGVLFIFIVFLRSWIHFSAGRLRNRFEREILVKPEE